MKPTTSQRVFSPSSTLPSSLVTWSTTATPPTARPAARITAMPCVVRRTASTAHATSWPTAVEAAIQITMPISAAATLCDGTP